MGKESEEVYEETASEGKLPCPKGERILVTGGTGFIGSTLVERLIEENQIIILDNRKRDALRSTKLEQHKNLTMIEADILDARKVKEALEGCDRVVHLAAVAGIDTVTQRPSMTIKVNLMGTINVLEAALGAQRRPKRIVCFSTSEVYGPLVYRGKEDDMTTQGPVGVLRWNYAVSKIAAEHWAHAIGRDEGLDVVTLRPFNIYGPRQVGEGAVRKFTTAAVCNEDIVIYGDGNQIRSWCYVTDMVEGTIRAMTSPTATGQSYNIGNPAATVTIRGLAERIIERAGSRSRIVYRERDFPDVEIRVPNIDKARRDLGYVPRVGLDEGLDRTIQWFRK